MSFEDGSFENGSSGDGFPFRPVLVAATGIDDVEWLARLHTDYTAPIEPEGTGVGDAEELTL